MNPELLYPEIGNRIRRGRRRLELRQEDLAKRIGISRASLANIEVGRQKILVHQLYAIAIALGLPLSDLLPSVPARLELDSLSLPDNLKPHEREQIARLVLSDLPQEARPKETTNAAKTKR